MGWLDIGHQGACVSVSLSVAACCVNLFLSVQSSPDQGVPTNIEMYSVTCIHFVSTFYYMSITMLCRCHLILNSVSLNVKSFCHVMHSGTEHMSKNERDSLK